MRFSASVSASAAGVEGFAVLRGSGGAEMGLTGSGDGEI
jgi:hypothetical protein